MKKGNGGTGTAKATTAVVALTIRFVALIGGDQAILREMKNCPWCLLSPRVAKKRGQ